MSKSTSPTSNAPTAAGPSSFSAKLVKIGGQEFDVTQIQHRGILYRVKFKNDSGFVVCTIGPVSCVGVIHQINVGAEYLLTGEWEEEKKYGSGWQFKFKTYEVFVDAKRGLKELLIRECQHIGPALAARIVTTFGDEAMQVLAHHPEKLTAISGISEAVAKSIQGWAKAERSNLDIKKKLYGIGLLPAQVDKLLKEYGTNAEQKIRQDCFTLTAIKGFGFKTVASIADLLGIPKSDTGRVKAAIMYTMQENCEEEGHTCMVASELIRGVAILNGVSQECVGVVLDQMIRDEELLTDKMEWAKYVEKMGIVLP